MFQMATSSNIQHQHQHASVTKLELHLTTFVNMREKVTNYTLTFKQEYFTLSATNPYPIMFDYGLVSNFHLFNILKKYSRKCV